MYSINVVDELTQTSQPKTKRPNDFEPTFKNEGVLVDSLPESPTNIFDQQI